MMSVHALDVRCMKRVDVECRTMMKWKDEENCCLCWLLFSCITKEAGYWTHRVRGPYFFSERKEVASCMT